MTAQPIRSDHNDQGSNERSRQKFEDDYLWLRHKLQVLRIRRDEPVQLSLQLDAVQSPLQLEYRAIQAERKVRELMEQLTEERNGRLKAEEELQSEREEVNYEPSYRDEPSSSAYERHLEARREYGMVTD